MLIDWFTVVAQTLNFLILVWLLKRFLYKPILDAIDAREQLIATKIADVAKKQNEAKQERNDFQQKNTDFEQQRIALLKKATDEASNERQRLLGEARAAADALTANRKVALEREQQDFTIELSRLTRSEVFAIARKTLVDVADVQLDVCATRIFIERLRNLPEDAKNSFSDAIGNSKEGALIRTAFELPGAQRGALQQAINDVFSANVSLKYETAPDAIGGIEFSVQGQALDWTIDKYLGALERGIAGMIASSNSTSPIPGNLSDTKAVEKK